MKYEIVRLAEKKVIGLQARTNNTSPDMSAIIGGLWECFYRDGIYDNISGKINGKALGIYSGYEGSEKDDYDITVACEVENTDGVPKETVSFIIPAGNYAKFIVKGDMHTAVAEFWQKLWALDLPRTFVCDFEEYQDSNTEHAEIHMYIGVQ
jgi:predicted transcriptional regulator YdeE